MKLNEQNNINILNEPLDAMDVIRKKTNFEMDEEPLYVCNVSDIIEKHQIWKQQMPRVMPFYGKWIEYVFSSLESSRYWFSSYWLCYFIVRIFFFLLASVENSVDFIECELRHSNCCVPQSNWLSDLVFASYDAPTLALTLTSTIAIANDKFNLYLEFSCVYMLSRLMVISAGTSHECSSYLYRSEKKKQ